MPWEDYTDDEGEKYYFNHDTEYSTYDISEAPRFIARKKSMKSRHNPDEVAIEIDNDDDDDDNDGDIEKNEGDRDQIEVEIRKGSITISPLMGFITPTSKADQ